MHNPKKWMVHCHYVVIKQCRQFDSGEKNDEVLILVSVCSVFNTERSCLSDKLFESSVKGMNK